MQAIFDRDYSCPDKFCPLDTPARHGQNFSGYLYAVVQTAILFFVVGLTVVNLLVDLSYAYLNPRVRARFEG